MNPMKWLSGTGRRRFNQADAVAARAAAEHWMARALAAEADLAVAARERDEAEAALDAGLTQYAELDARHTEMRAKLTAAHAKLANRDSVTVDAPADLGRVKNRAEETTEAINVTTLRARFGAGPVPAMPVGGAA